MRKLASIVVLAMLAATPVLAQTAAPPPFPDLSGTWTGQSESIVSHGANPHHGTSQSSEPRLSSIPFTMTINRQDGRRFSGSFASLRSTEPIIGVLSRNNTILIADTDGYTMGTLLGPDRLELCYLQSAANGRVASCTEMTRRR